MSTTRDWLPASSTINGKRLENRHDRQCGRLEHPLPPVITELDAFIQTADAALAVAKNETTRTPMVTAQCREAFEALTAKMRDIKKRYFLTPPLTEVDYIALGLKPRDSTCAAIGTPAPSKKVQKIKILSIFA